jgi:hypothetical protein
MHFLQTIAAVWFALGIASSVRADEPPAKPESASAERGKKLYSGKVVDAQAALKKRGIKAFDELKGQVVLETTDGRLLPIIPDWRGRAFFQDERLRNRPVDLIGFQKPGVPYLQVLVVYTFDEQGIREYTDYWCDICSIPMYEIKPCDCCQGDIRLRFQPQELPATQEWDSSAGTKPPDEGKPLQDRDG